jgi:hypothetical protein
VYNAAMAFLQAHYSSDIEANQIGQGAQELLCSLAGNCPKP